MITYFQTFESTIEQPVELCELQPQQHCSTVKVSVPRLIPEKRCRQVEKEICNTRLKNGQNIKKPVRIKYCTKKSVSSKPSYLPPPPLPVYGSPPKKSPAAAPPVQYRPRPTAAYTPSPVYSRPLGSGRNKRDPTTSFEVEDPVDIITVKPVFQAKPVYQEVPPIQAASVRSPRPLAAEEAARSVDAARSGTWSPVL